MDTLTQENVVLSQNEPILPENPKKFNFLIILLSVLLFISSSIAVFFAYQTQKLVKELVILEKSSMPISTMGPIMTPDPTADWETYKYKDLFEIKIPQDLKINDRGYGHVEIGDFLTVGVYSTNPEDCRGDCSIIDTKVSKKVNNLETKYLTGWWGDIGGNVGQAYVSYVIPNNNQYVYLQMQELPFSMLTRPVREKVGSVNQENIKLLNQIISTFKFNDLETLNWKTYKYLDMFELKVPENYKIVDKGYNRVELGEYLSIQSSDVNPEDCKGDCTISGIQPIKVVNGISMKYVKSWWGEIGGNIAQSFIAYIVPIKNKYVTIQFQELPFTAKYEVGRDVKEISQDRVQLFDQILSTFKLIN